MKFVNLINEIHKYFDWLVSCHGHILNRTNILNSHIKQTFKKIFCKFRNNLIYIVYLYLTLFFLLISRVFSKYSGREEKITCLKYIKLFKGCFKLLRLMTFL